MGAPDPGYGVLFNKLANPPNPFEQLGQAANALSAAKQFQADRAVADAYKASVDPTTGAFDQGKFNALASQGPGSWKFGDTMRSAGTGFGAEGQGTTANVQATVAQLGATSQFMYPLLQKATSPGGVVSGQEAQAALDQAHGLGLVNDQVYQRVSQQIAQIPPGGNANSIVIGASMGNDTALKALQPEYQGAGGYIFQRNPMAYGGAPAAGPVVTTTMTPDTAGQMVSVHLPSGQDLQVTLGQAQQILKTNPELARLNPDLGQQRGTGGGATAPGHFPQPAAPAPAAPAPAAGGGSPTPQPPPTEQPNINAPAYTQPPGPPSAEAGGVGTTQAPGYQENVAVPSQKAATALVVAAKDTPNVNGLIDDMRSQVNQPGWNPGLGAQAGSTWRQLLDKVGINATGQAPTAIKDAQAAYDEFSKDANLIATRQLGTLGNPSDARQSLAEAITPGMAQSKEGVLGISATLKGNQDAINRTAAAWATAKTQGWTDARHNEWIDQRWNATDPASGGRFDPRVFWLADTAGTAADQNRRFASKIPKDQQAQFLKNVQYAKDQGWIAQDGQGGAFSVVNP